MQGNLTSSFHLLASLGTLLPQFAVSADVHCRCFPGDACWPSRERWAAFNKTLGGKLVETIPLAAPCHDSRFGQYNAGECNTLQEAWTLPQTHYDSSSSIMAPFFANQSCDPFTGIQGRCILGTYNRYAVAVGSASDVSKALRFTERNNIRITIRNTGHDYNGKSAGAGSLGIWTHHLKDIQISDHRSRHYTGKAMKMGAGVQGFEAYAAAHQHGLVVLGGECPTVGLAGGYAQGGGHSTLGSKYGLAADQVLEWEVVDARGRHLTASRAKNSDLFWALSGGGGGTFGVVLSMTVKAHADMPTSGGNLSFTSDGISQDTFWKAIEAYHVSLPAIVDEGIMSVSAFSTSSFAISPMTGPGVSAERMNELLQPLTSTLDRLGIKYTKLVKQFPNYFEEFNTMFAPIQVGIAQYGGRLVPRSAVLNNNSAVTHAYRKIANDGGAFFIVGINVSTSVAGDVYNSINPAWRDTLLDTVVTTPWNFTAPWSQMVANANKMTDKFIPILKDISPGSGTYINEADFQDPDFKQDYYGVNYDRLLQIKQKYDPNHTFYALTAVGSDYWEARPDGRLCKSRRNA
ncbi:hypothetical protein M409DRAFT_35390 [Zasmidium cellare ATCC 36951]|uniref:FAD-binding PCMH-type domain-containing protein n=1 Tax=Zasmidium cellare ATCC 36951 TaxID=1080233 RepID=A0A6A6D338_ZASCE|nr:uncharacterized protein M409DRAFT_35390 [Zasmidium cellare ATCC 36951]KAF2172800.1 hypothetical protein M409DRAFT_35390 [Zasmidium cellare ATCC 36951]